MFKDPLHTQGRGSCRTCTPGDKNIGARQKILPTTEGSLNKVVFEQTTDGVRIQTMRLFARREFSTEQTVTAKILGQKHVVSSYKTTAGDPCGQSGVG